jgi:hypothetical protein
MDQISVRDNDVTVRGKGAWSTGIRIASSASNHVRDVSVIGNSVRGATEGIRFESAHFERTPFCALNRIGADVASPWSDSRTFPRRPSSLASSRGGTAAHSGAGRRLAGLGDPNNSVLGDVGDMFQRLDGAPGTTLYIKEAGSNTNTHWTPK